MNHTSLANQPHCARHIAPLYMTGHDVVYSLQTGTRKGPLPPCPRNRVHEGKADCRCCNFRLSIIDSVRFAFLFPKELLDGRCNFLRRHEDGGMIQTLQRAVLRRRQSVGKRLRPGVKERLPP